MQLFESWMQLCAIIMQLLGRNELQRYSKPRLIICPKWNTALWNCTMTFSFFVSWRLSCGNISFPNKRTCCPPIQHWTIAHCIQKNVHQAVIMCIQDIPNYLCAEGVTRNIMVVKAWVHLINPDCIDHKPSSAIESAQPLHELLHYSKLH